MYMNCVSGILFELCISYVRTVSASCLSFWLDNDILSCGLIYIKLVLVLYT